jgi:hypothetical protein
MSKAQGQITIIDYNDAITLTGFINSNHMRAQMYNPDNGSYTPDWATTNLVLTPSLYVAGTTTDVIDSSAVQSVKWFDGSSSTAIIASSDYALSGAKSQVLTVKANVLAGLPGKDFRCEVVYLDSTTKLSLKHTMSISFSRSVNGGGIAALICSTPLGNVFKNTEVTSLSATAQLWRGSVLDTTNVTYQWYKMDSTVTTDQGGGVGWAKLTETANKHINVTGATMTVYSGDVDSFATYKCIATDTDTASNTKNQTFVDTVSFIDNSDPLQVVIQSSGGDVFKNGVGSTNLTARVYQAGVEKDADIGNSTGVYTWTKYNNAGTVDTTWGTSGKKTGKTLTVGDGDVDVKATFMCEVTLN